MTSDVADHFAAFSKNYRPQRPRLKRGIRFKLLEPQGHDIHGIQQAIRQR
jgi:hypothetical protein